MSFYTIFMKTLVDLLSLRRTILLVIVGIIPTIIMSLTFSANVMKVPMSLQYETHLITGVFSVIIFMWVSGMYLVVSVSATGANFISKEDTEGTMLIMISKPFHMYEMVLGKFLALVINTMLIQLIVLLTSFLIFWFMLPVDPETIESLVGIMPWVLLYSLLVTVVFSAGSIALSTMIKSRVKITLILMLIAILIYFVGMIVRLLFATEYENYWLYYGDLGYHLGNTFYMFMENASTGQLMPIIQIVYSIFTGVFESIMDSYDPDIGAYPSSLDLTNYLRPIFSALVWVGISVGSLVLAMLAIERKEVH